MPDAGACRKRQISCGRIPDDFIAFGSRRGAPRAAFAPNFVPFAQHPPKIGRAATISAGSLIA